MSTAPPNPEIPQDPHDWTGQWRVHAGTRPRVWTALSIGILALPAGMIVSLVVTAIAVAVMAGPETLRSRAEFSRQAELLTTSPTGLTVMILPGQLTFIVCAFGAALFSPDDWRERLRLVRGSFPLWSWPVLALGTPVVAFLTSLSLGLFMQQPSEHMQRMEQMFRQQDLSVFPLLLLLIGGLPGFAEELMFRGYLQSRLLRAWPVGVSILLSAIIFGMAHIDPTHALHVIPLGVWLGILAWRTESVWPAVLGHAANNSLALVMLRLIDRTTTPPTVNPLVGFLVMATMGSFVAALVLLVTMGRPMTRHGLFGPPNHP